MNVLHLLLLLVASITSGMLAMISDGLRVMHAINGNTACKLYAVIEKRHCLQLVQVWLALQNDCGFSLYLKSHRN